MNFNNLFEKAQACNSAIKNTLSKCAGEELNFPRGEKLNPKDLVGKFWKYKIHRGN